jgi:hypothetical protein
VRTVPGGAHFNLAIELDGISLQRNAKSNQFVGAGVLRVGADVLRIGAGMLFVSTGMLLISAGMLNFSAVKAILCSLRELLHRVPKDFRFDFHLHTLAGGALRITAETLDSARTGFRESESFRQIVFYR